MVIVPIVSTQDVRAALESMVNPSLEPSLESLTLLYLVEDARHAASSPHTPSNDAYWVYDTLNVIISDTLVARRKSHDLLDETMEISRIKDAEAAIRVDGATDDKELIYWSMLYFCFVRVDLNITLEAYGQIVGLTERTMRRYREYAIRRLTHEVIRREQMIRLKKKSRLLLNNLPVTPTKYVGHDDLLDQVSGKIRQDPSLSILIYGDKGIGKSTFVAQLLKLCLQSEQNVFNYMIWIDGLEDIEQIINRIRPGLSTKYEVKSWLAENPTIVVVDGLAGQSIRLVDEIADVLRDSLLIVIERMVILPGKFNLRIKHPAMSYGNIKELIRWNLMATHGESQFSDDTIETIAARSGGNPGLATKLAQQVLYEDTDEYVRISAPSKSELEAVIANIQVFRRSGEYTKARMHLTSHRLLARHRRDTQVMRRLELEEIITYRVSGEFTQALKALDDLLIIAQEQDNHFIYDSALLESARVYLDTHKIEYALDAVQQITHPDVKIGDKYRIIRAEIAVHCRRFDESKSHAETIIRTSQSRYSKGQAYDLLGHGHVANDAMDDAENSFICALSCFDAVSEPLSYARTLNNLGAVYIGQSRMVEAQRVLEHAYAIQRHYKDNVSLLYTTKNLSLLKSE